MATKTPPPTDEPVLPPGSAPPPDHPPPVEPPLNAPPVDMPPPSSKPPSPDGIPQPPGSAPMTPGTAPAPKQGETEQPSVTPPPLQVQPPTDAQYAWFAANPKYSPISASLARYIHRGTLSTDGTFTPEGPGTPVINSTDGSFGVGIPA
jgi:hypothetical protein